MSDAASSHRRLDDALTVGALVASLVAPALGVALRGGASAVDPSERREPATWPAASAPASWLGGASAWFHDRVPWRHAAIRAHHRARLALGATRVGQVLVGDAGWLYYADGSSLASLTGVPALAPEVASEWAATIDARRRYVERATGAPYVFLLAADKHDVVDEHLPAAWRDARRGRGADDVMAALRARGVRAVDPRAALRAARAAGVETYLRTDSHWTHDGAALAAQAVLQVVAADLPGLDPEAPARAPRLRRSEPRGLDLSALLGLADLLPEGEVVEVIEAAPAPGSRRVALLGDSFAPALALGLRHAGLEVEILHYHALDSVAGLGPSLVIEELVQRDLTGPAMRLAAPPLAR